MQETLTRPSFYGLSFGAQLLVWAVRRRLDMLQGGADETAVAEAFRRAGLDGVHEAVTALVDVLLCGSSTALTVHAVTCPCLARHELTLVEALHHLQAGERERAGGVLERLFCAAAQRLVLPCLDGIAASFRANGMTIRVAGQPALAPRREARATRLDAAPTVH